MARKIAAALLSAAAPFADCFHIANRPSENKITLVTDLDNTLIHSKEIVDEQNYPSRRFYIELDDEIYYVRPRPFLQIFLVAVAAITNLHMCTRADREYAEKIVEQIGADGIFQSMLTRDDFEEKDLKLFAADPAQAVLLDDLAENQYDDQPFYHIRPYKYHHRGDCELLKVLAWIMFQYVQRDCAALWSHL